MKKIRTSAELKAEIASLEIRLATDRDGIKNEFRTLYESITLANLVRKTARELAAAPEFKNNIGTIIMSMSASFISRKVVAGSSKNPIRILIGSLVAMGVTRLVSKNADSIKTMGAKLISNLFSNTTKQQESTDEKHPASEYQYEHEQEPIY